MPGGVWKAPQSRGDPVVGPGGELGGRPGAALVTSTSSPSSPLLTGTLPQSAPRCGPPAQPCWPVCKRTQKRPGQHLACPGQEPGAAQGGEAPSPQPWPPPPSSARSRPPGAGVLWAILSSSHLRPWQERSPGGEAVPFQRVPRRQLLWTLCALLGLWEAGVPP